jgi:hypothetical protein
VKRDVKKFFKCCAETGWLLFKGTVFVVISG